MSQNFSVRLDKELKAKAFAVIEGFGLTPELFVQLVLKQVADTHSLPLSFEPRLNPKTQQSLHAAREEFQTATRYDDFEALWADIEAETTAEEAAAEFSC